MKPMFRKLLCALAVAGLALPAATRAEETISAVHVFPKTLIYTKSFLALVDKLNAAGKGVFKIQVRGGPEAIPQMQQANAVRDGVVDMIYSPCAFYSATVPECDATSATTIDGPTARKNGALALLNKAHNRQLNAELLGWVDSGIRFHLWSVKEPKLDSTGHVDVKGFKVRGNAIYNAFFGNYLGAQVLNVNMPEIYTALERGTIEMMGWTQIGLMDANWDRYIKYRIEPNFFSTDLMVLMNKKRWDALPANARDIITRTVAEHEVSSLKALQELWAKEKVELEKRGIKTIVQSPEASKRFVAGARDATLARMKERMTKAGSAGDYDAVRKALLPE